MTTPSPRNSIRTARGLYSDLLASVADLGDGELCYSIDHDKFYTPNGSGGLLEVGKGTAIASIGQLGDVDLTGLQSGELLKWDGTSWSPAADLAGSAVQPGDDISDLNNDAGYITSAEAPVQPGDIPVVGAGVITLESYGEGAAADSTFQMNQILNQTVTLPQFRTSDLNNDSGFITSVDVDAVPVAGGQFTGDVEIGTGIDLNADGTANLDGRIQNGTVGNAAGTFGTILGPVGSDRGRLFIYSSTEAESALAIYSAPDSATGKTVKATISNVGSATFASKVVAGGTYETTERTITAGSFDLSTGNHWTCGAITVPAPTNATAGTSGLIRITAGPVVWNGVFKFPGGAAPTIAAFPAIIPFYVQSSSEILMGNVAEGIA